MFDAKRTGETIALSIDFTNLLDSGESLQSASDWAASVRSGTDGSPGDIISGSASIDGTKSTQTVTGGTDGVEYWLVAEVTTDQSQTLQVLAVLPVEDAES